MKKTYNQREFTCEINGRVFNFNCETSRTRNGFCHHVYDFSQDYGTKRYHTRVSYFNRTWESFDYESALKSHFEKYDKELAQALRMAIIDREHACINREMAAWEKSFKAFSENLQKVRQNRPDAYKNVEVNSTEDANLVMGLVALEALVG